MNTLNNLWQKCDRMDHGMLSSQSGQKKRHQKRLQRLEPGSRQSQVHPGLAPKHCQCECADGGYCGRLAEGGVWGVGGKWLVDE